MNEHLSPLPNELHASRDTGSESGVEEVPRTPDFSSVHERQQYDQVLERHLLEMQRVVRSSYDSGKISEVNRDELLGQLWEILSELPSGGLRLRVRGLADKLRIPEEDIQTYQIEHGGKTGQQLKEELVKQNIYVNRYAQSLLDGSDFERSRLKETKRTNLVRLSLKELGFTENATMKQIEAKLAGIGLELCSSDVGPELRLQSKDTTFMFIAMEQIHGYGGGGIGMFGLKADGGRLELGMIDAMFGGTWSIKSEFIFAFRN